MTAQGEDTARRSTKIILELYPFNPNVYNCYCIVKILILKKEGIMGKFPMSVALMSWQTIRAYFRLYLKN